MYAGGSGRARVDGRGFLGGCVLIYVSELYVCAVAQMIKVI